MQMFIPEIGTKLRLTADWAFPLYDEGRNAALFVSFGIERKHDTRNWVRYQQPLSYPVTMPADTILTVDRIYIRKGVEKYSSVSFWIAKESKTCAPASVRRIQGRFWAKLADVNTIQFDLL